MPRTVVRFVLVLSLWLTGCYGLPPKTEKAVRAAISANKGHAADKALPTPAREIAMDNHDVLWQILYGADVVDELPKDVKARMDARKKKATK